MTAPAKNLVALAAGGTGGHVFPAEALAAELAGRGYDLALITDRRGDAFGTALDAIDIYRIRAGGIAGKSFLARINSALELAIGTLQARRLLKRLNPAAVIGFGGYASIPSMLAASSARYPTAIHEQNAVLGRANRLLANRVARIATSFEVSEGIPADAAGKIVHTGMPVRPAVAAVRDHPYPAIEVDGRLRLLVLGGSQGAHVFSEVLPGAVALLPEALRQRLDIAQQCRPEDLEDTAKAYRDLDVEAEVSPFFGDVPERLAAAHLVIARAGASTVAEVAAVGRPAILVAYPHAIDDHQSANAHAVDEAGAGWLMPQDAFTPETLSNRLVSLFDLPATLERAAAASLAAGRPGAAARLADMVCALHADGGGA